MKKILLISGIMIAIGSVALLTVQKVQNSKNAQNDTYDTTRLSTVTINNISYETTGVVPTKNNDRQQAFREGVKLLNKGPVNTSSFRIKMPGDGTIHAELLPPYDKSKLELEKWLDSNGFSHITLNQLIISEVKN